MNVFKCCEFRDTFINNFTLNTIILNLLRTNGAIDNLNIFSVYIISDLIRLGHFELNKF